MPSRRRYVVASVAVLTVLAGPAAASRAAEKSVFAGPPKPIKNLPAGAEVTQFFPKRITVARGDRISFEMRGFHTITFLGKSEFPAFAVPDGSKVSGANDASGQPFWFNGLDELMANPLTAFPAGDGKVLRTGYENSGLPTGEETPPYELTFPKAGTFRYLCQIHPHMRGVVKVVKRHKRVPAKSSDAARIAKQTAKALKKARKAANIHGPSGGNVLAGNSVDKVEVLKFFPADITVLAGDSVRWKAAHFHDFHTISFGPADELKGLNDAFIAPRPNPSGPPSLVLNPLALFPSEQPGATPTFDGANHGNGFFNSGIIDGDPATPLPREFTATFTRPGTYSYICLVHGPQMKGTVTVTG